MSVCPVGSALLRYRYSVRKSHRGADGVVNAMNFKRRGEAGRTPDAIALVTTYGPTAFRPRGRALRQRRTPGNAGNRRQNLNQANARVILVSFRRKARICDACSIERNA